MVFIYYSSFIVCVCVWPCVDLFMLDKYLSVYEYAVIQKKKFYKLN